jgi:hypothetical protein
MSEPHKPDAENPEVAHEASDVNVGVILRYGAGLLVVGAIVQLFLWWLLGVYEGQHQRAQTQVFPMAVGQQDRRPPEPRLQNNPQQELRDLRAKQEGLLNGYGWVNKEGGVARIPIDEAMRMVVEKGLPVREPQK